MILLHPRDANYLASSSQRKSLQQFDAACSRLKKVPLSYWQFVVQLGLVVCLSFSLAHLFWLVFPVPVVQEIVVKTQVTDSKQTTLIPSLIDIKQLKNLHIFGKEENIKNPIPPAVVNIQTAETQLNLILAGVVASNYEQRARAIISTNNQQELYSIGEVLPAGEGVTLAAVLMDRIIINNNGTLESLYLDEKKATQKQLASTGPLISREESQKLLEWQADHAEPEAPPARYRPAVSLPDQAITAMERTMSNVINMNSFTEGGKLAGFKISPGRDADKFKELGLQTNDVIVAINGWPMSDPTQILDMYQNLGDSGSANVQIKRGTSVISVDVALQ